MRLVGLFAAALGCLISTTSTAQQFSVALFSKTAGWHHEATNEGVDAIRQLGALHHFDVFWTENADLLFKDDILKRYKVVIFLLTTGDVLNDEQQAAFERYIRAGNGYVGVHSASDTEYDWEWYTKMVGHMFVMHPPIQTATIEVKERNFPGMDRFPDRFLFTEEWYEFDAPRSPNLRYLLAVDHTTYSPLKRPKGNPSFYPLSWYQEYDGGRAFYTALGHIPATYADQMFMHHLYGGIYWAATGKGFRAQ